jgi:hypothetical protein
MQRAKWKLHPTPQANLAGVMARVIKMFVKPI